MCEDFIDDGGDEFWDGLDWEDWMIIGPLSEDIAREKREKDRIIRENVVWPRWDLLLPLALP